MREQIQKAEQNDADSDTSAPVDLWAKFDPPQLPRDVLPDVIEAFAFQTADLMGVDEGGLAIAALVTCAGALSDMYRVQVKPTDQGWTESARLWAALIGEPSSKKSPQLSKATTALVSARQRRLSRIPATQSGV